MMPQTETENCGESTLPPRINWTSFILQMPLNPSLLGLIAALCLDWDTPSSSRPPLKMKSVFYFTFKWDLIWPESGTGKVLISTSFPLNIRQPKGIHSFSAKTKKLLGLKLLQAALSAEQKLSLRQIVLHFIS